MGMCDCDDGIELSLRLDIIEDLTDQTGLAERDHMSLFIKDCEAEEVEQVMAMLGSNFILLKIYDWMGQEYILSKEGELILDPEWVDEKKNQDEPGSHLPF